MNALSSKSPPADDDDVVITSSKQEYEVEVHEAQQDDHVIIVDKNQNQNQDEQEKEEKDKIQKGIAFWNHPSLQDISPVKKRTYLYERQGLTDNQIHKVWEDIVVNDNKNNINSKSNSNDQMQQQQNMVMQQQRSNNNMPPMMANHQISPTNNLPYGNNNNIHPQHQNQHQNQYQNSQYNNSINNNGYYQQQQQQQPFNMGLGDGGGVIEDYRHQEGGEYAESSISGEIARGMSLIAVGGFLGLTGAAAIRWLNGGEFDLLPPPKQHEQQREQSGGEKISIISSNNNSTLLDRQQVEEEEEEEEDNDGNNNDKKFHWNNNGDDGDYDGSTDEYSDGEEVDDDIERCLLDRMDTLLKSIDSNSTLQERLIHKLANTSTITDHSMNLLKKNNDNSTERQQQKEITATLNTSLLVSELTEIKDGFTKLMNRENNIINETTTNNDSSNGNDTNNDSTNNDNDGELQHNWKEGSSELLIKLDSCIQKIITIEEEEEKRQPSAESIIIATTADDLSTTTAAIAATPTAISKTLRQDDITISSAPSTPASSTSKQTVDSSTPTTTAINTNANTTTTTKPLLSLKDCIIQIAEKNNDNKIKIGSQLLYLFLTNLSSKPDNQRYRKIYTSNESFQKVENMIGGKDLLQVVGFEFEDDDDNNSNKGILEWIPTKSTEKEMLSLILVKEAIAALGVLKSSASLPSSQLIQLASSKLSHTPPILPTTSQQQQQQQQQEYDNNDDDRSNHGDGNGNNTYNHNPHDTPAAPQTPSGSSLVSPPMPRKKPYDFASPSPVSGSD
jgi:hypothetical protein